MINHSNITLRSIYSLKISVPQLNLTVMNLVPLSSDKTLISCIRNINHHIGTNGVVLSPAVGSFSLLLCFISSNIRVQKCSSLVF